jgi:hypothetical protein
MNYRSPIRCPVCLRPMVVHPLQSQDRPTIVITECRDCGVMLNRSRPLRGSVGTFSELSRPSSKQKGRAGCRSRQDHPPLSATSAVDSLVRHFDLFRSAFDRRGPYSRAVMIRSICGT